MQQVAQPPGDLALAAAHERLSSQGLETAIGDPARLRDLRDLLVVLDRADPIDETARRNELGSPRTEALPLNVREDIGLELHPPRQPRASIIHHRPLRDLHLDAANDDRLCYIGS